MSPEPTRWLKRVTRYIWSRQRAGQPVWERRGLRLARLLIVLARDVIDGELTLWAMSLVYTTLLSMVPLLALSFSVLKAFGVHNQIEPLLDNLLAPLGPEAHEISGRLIAFISHVNVGVLGAVGLTLLIYTVVSLAQKVEQSFNAIWHIKRLRSVAERFSRYLSLLLIGPLLVFAAIGITTSAMSSHVVQTVFALAPLAYVASKLTPYALVIGAFTFTYIFVPNTRVRFLPALLAGILGGVLWQSAGWGFAAFVVSAASYSAIYSSFAILVLFLIWLYVSWLVLLIGAAVAFYVQHPEFLYEQPGEPPLSHRMRERLAVGVMYMIGLHFVRGRPPWTLDRLAQRLGIPMYAVQGVLDALAVGDLVRPTNDDPPAYLPVRELSQVTITEVLAAVRQSGEESFLDPDSLPLAASAEQIVTSVENAIAQSTASRSVFEMIDMMPSGS